MARANRSRNCARARILAKKRNARLARCGNQRVGDGYTNGERPKKNERHCR